MSRHQEILFGVTGQAFVLDVLEGRPSSPDVDVFRATSSDDDGPEPATTGAASVDAVATTLDTAVIAGESELELDSTASIARGRRYLLGGLEWCEVMAMVGTTVRLRRPVINDHAIGTAFESCRISIAVDADWAAENSHLIAEGYRLRWTYTVNGAPTVGVSYAALVRYPSRVVLTALDVDDRIAGFIDRLPPDHREDQGAALIASAFDALRFDALGDAQLLGMIRDTQALRELAIYRSNLVAVEAQVLAGGATADALTAASDLYKKRYQQLIREPKVPADATGSGAATKARRLPVWRR